MLAVSCGTMLVYRFIRVEKRERGDLCCNDRVSVRDSKCFVCDGCNDNLMGCQKTRRTQSCWVSNFRHDD
jgi:hypothetical protein